MLRERVFDMDERVFLLRERVFDMDERVFLLRERVFDSVGVMRSPPKRID